MPYIGRAATNAGSVNYLDDISSGFDGNDVTFTCAVKGTTITPGQENVYLYLDGVFQHPGDSYTISGSTITFTEAPVSGADFTGYVAGEGAYLDDGTVSTVKLDDDAVTASKLDDDGTGFQVGDLGVGGSLTSGDKLTVTGRLRASGGIIGDLTGDVTGDLTGNVTGNVTGNTSGTAATVTGAAQTAITSVGTLTGLTVNGAATSTTLAINGSIGSHKLVVDNGTTSLNRGNTGGDILDVRGLNASQFKVATSGSTFTGDVTINTSSHSTLLIKGADSCDAELALQSDNADDNTDKWSINAKHSAGGTLHFATYGSGSWTNPLVLAHNLATFGTNVQVPNGYQFQWGGANNAIFGHHTSNYVKIKTGGVDRFTVSDVGGVTMKSGGDGSIAKGFMLQNSGDTNNYAAIFEENTSPTSGELRLYSGGSEKVYLRANSSSSNAFLFKGGQMQDITANNTGIQYRANWDTGFLNRIDNNFDGASAASSYMRFKIASGAGSQNTALTMYGDGDVECSAKFAVLGNHSGSFATELFNSSSTGHGTKIRGGSTGSHYALFVSNYNQTNSAFQVLADGSCTAGSNMVAPYFRTQTSTTSAANNTWHNVSGLTNLSAGMYLIFSYKDDYNPNAWAASGTVRDSGHSDCFGVFDNTSYFELRTSGSNVQVRHQLGSTFDITTSWIKVG